MTKILALFITLVVLSGCQTVQDDIRPTDKPLETIIKEAPFHQGESVHVVQSEVKRCIVSGCNGSTCSYETKEAIGCRFSPQDECYKKAICKPLPYSNVSICGWEETEEFKECRKKINEEITEVNRRFKEIKDNCDPNKSCTYEYSFRSDRFEFTLFPGQWPLFGGYSIVIRISGSDDDTIPNQSFPVFRIAIDIDEHFVDSFEIFDVEKIQVQGASGIKYKTNSIWSKDGCDAYRLEYKDKFYYFEGYEGCLSFGDEFSDSLRFYEN